MNRKFWMKKKKKKKTLRAGVQCEIYRQQHVNLWPAVDEWAKNIPCNIPRKMSQNKLKFLSPFNLQGKLFWNSRITEKR